MSFIVYMQSQSLNNAIWMTVAGGESIMTI